MRVHIENPYQYESLIQKSNQCDLILSYDQNIISMIKIQIHMKFILKTHIENTFWFFSTSASVCCFLGHLWYLAQYTD